MPACIQSATSWPGWTGIWGPDLDRVFTLEDQRDFALLSGDWNPVHVDPLAARRTMFGQPIVHGVHLVFRALDDLAGRIGPFAPAALKVDFSAPVALGTAVALEFGDAGPGQYRYRLQADGKRCASIRIAPRPFVPSVFGTGPARHAPRDWRIGVMADASGGLEVGMDAPLFARCFPHLPASAEFAQILACTRLVGMECPGLHSVFGGLDLKFPAPAGPGDLTWRVLTADERFSVLMIAIAAPGMEGRVQAYVRPAPTALPSAAEVARIVAPGSFSGARALVVGGSRGLGAAFALGLAAGGAEVRVTYHSGRDEAEEVAARTGGGAVKLDLSGKLDFAMGDWRPTHVGLFASPRIMPTPPEGFSEALLTRYSRFYVDPLRALAAPGVKLFYPSTIFIEEAAEQWQEYCAAKLAGEAMCRHLESTLPGFEALVARLPRAATDQTLALQPVAAQPPLSVLEPWLRGSGPVPRSTAD